MSAFTKEMQSQLTPKDALALLEEGNHRFEQNLKLNRNLYDQARETAGGQYPFAVILSCIDSRTAVELIFDLGFGDAFSVRVAGNVLNQDVLGSMEFACQVAGAKLIVVLGHSSCGAIKGACSGVEMGNLTALLHKVEPAIASAKKAQQEKPMSEADYVEKVAELNVQHIVKTLPKQSEILSQLIKSGQCGIIGAMHDLESGKVHFYKEQASF